MKLILILVFFLSVVDVFASRRWVDLSWREIDEASAYDIQLHVIDKESKQELYLEERLRNNKWSKQIPPGKYNFRIRSVDVRSVPGEWSDFSLLDIRLPRPIYVNPLVDDVLKGIEEFEEKVEFEWKKVEGANAYLIEVWNDEGFYKKEVTKDSTKSIALKVAKKYKWRVVSLVNLDDEIPTREGTGIKFFLMGAAIEVPKVKHVIKDGQVIINWKVPKYATEFEYQLYKLGLNQKWGVYKENNYHSKNELKFPLKDFQGEFRLALRAQGEGRAQSPYSFVEFGVKGNDFIIHSIKSQLTNDLKKDNPFFYSYGIEQTFLDYYGESREKDTVVETTFKGQRYFLEASYQDFYSLWKHRVGFYLTDVNNVEYSIRLKEFHYLFGRSRVYKGIPFEFSAGYFYKEDLFITGDVFTDELSFESVATSGPMGMISPYYRFNRAIDIGAELKLFVHLTAHETPSDEEVNTSFSYYVKGYVTYKYKDNETYTGFAGYYVNDISYKASTDGDSIAQDDSDNIAQSSGYSFGVRFNKFF